MEGETAGGEMRKRKANQGYDAYALSTMSLHTLYR
jgi:hypothetical protein